MPVQELFIRAFEGKPDQRPTALEWKQAMRNIITSSSQLPTPNPKPISNHQKATMPKTSQQPQPQNAQKMCCPYCGKDYHSVLSRFCDRCGKPRI